MDENKQEAPRAFLAEVWDTLSRVNVNAYTEKKNNLTYLSWSKCWEMLVKYYPNSRYEVQTFDGLPYQASDLGFMVWTSLHIEDPDAKLLHGPEVSHKMWLPVMSDRNENRAMKAESYTYKVKEYKDRKPTGNMIDKTVEAASMRDVNDAIMRCLVKNAAMFGLGHYIYDGKEQPAYHSYEQIYPNKPNLWDDPDARSMAIVGLSEGKFTIDQVARKYNIHKALDVLKQNIE